MRITEFSDHLGSKNSPSVRSHEYKLEVITRSDVIVVWWQLHLLWSLSRQPAVPEESGSPPSLFARPADHLLSSKSGWEVTCHQPNSQRQFFIFLRVCFLSSLLLLLISFQSLGAAVMWCWQMRAWSDILTVEHYSTAWPIHNRKARSLILPVGN